MAKYIGQDAEILDLPEKKYSLQEMYDMLACNLVQCIPLPEGYTMWIDEEGKFDSTKWENVVATSMALQNRAIFQNDFIVGHALILGPNEVD